MYDCAYPFIPGGGQKRLFEVARRLVAKGWSIDWYAFQSWPGQGETVVDGITYVPVAPSGDLYTDDGKRSIKQTLRYGAAIARFGRLRKYDLLHLGQWPYFHFFPARLFGVMGRGRLSAEWWETWGAHWLDYYGTKGWLGMLLERVCARIPARLVSISDVGTRQLRQLGVKAGRIEIIHNGINFDAIRGVAKGQESDVVYLGRLQPHKNVNLLIDAVALLRDRGIRVSLTVIGDGPELHALQEQVAKQDLRAQVSFAGAIERDEDVFGILRGSRIFVHPSTKEGGGSITSLEANAAGLPVVAFSHEGGISPELIEEGRNGYWIGEVSASALADGMAKALAIDDEICAQRCVAFAERFDWDGIAEQYHAMFCDQLRRK